MTAASLRRLVVAEKLECEKISGKYFVTLLAIEEMRKSCRVPAKVPVSNLSNTATDERLSGSSEMGSEPLALDAMNLTAEELKKSLRPTSSKSTTRKKPSAKVIRMESR
jgi:hypothetical protein